MLGQIAWTTTLGVEALRKKVVRLRPSKKSEGEKRNTMTYDFLGPVMEIFIFSLSLLFWIPRKISMNLPILPSLFQLPPLYCDSDFVPDPSRSLYTSKAQT